MGDTLDEIKQSYLRLSSRTEVPENDGNVDSTSGSPSKRVKTVDTRDIADMVKCLHCVILEQLTNREHFYSLLPISLDVP